MAIICLLLPYRATADGGAPPFWLNLLQTGQALFFHIAFLYLSLNIFYQLITGRKRLGAYLRFIGKIILLSFAYHGVLYSFLPVAIGETYSSLPDLWCTTMQHMLPMLILSFIFAYLTNVREALIQRRIWEAQKLQLEMEKAQANFNFLKAQINPHFLHNTLNFFYAKSLPYSEELSEGILTLSDIMRYALSEHTRQDGKALLTDEVEHVNNVIKIHQMRFDHRLQVQFEVSGLLDGVLIVPFVLITLVENAFKHGDLNDPSHPLEIRLQATDGRLVFYCRNKKKNGPKQLTTGIGLENIKKRLELAYGERFRLMVADQTDFYAVELQIDGL
ncbi:MAG: histidine kinase [Saprospiraceae bacterium]|nr:histidine kinase [Saprospiraceae bacterium]